MCNTAWLAVAMIWFGLGAVSAQTPACSPTAVTADPFPVDSAYPPAVRVVQIPSGGARLNGVLYLSQGRGRHRTVVFLHGFPGDEKNLDLAQAVRRAGLNALVFYYRGAWGSPGAYSYSHMLEDVDATLAWLHDPAIADSMRVDPGHLIIVGHSVGGFAALYRAAARDEIEAVAALAPVDLGSRGAAMRDSVTFEQGKRWLGTQLNALRGTSSEALSRELLAHAEEWSLQRYAEALAKKRILLLAATHDEGVPLAEVFEPLSAKLRLSGARQLTRLTLPSDHVFSSVRVGLAQALIRWLCAST